VLDTLLNLGATVGRDTDDQQQPKKEEDASEYEIMMDAEDPHTDERLRTLSSGRRIARQQNRRRTV
jgi:hypothetical protein